MRHLVAHKEHEGRATVIKATSALDRTALNVPLFFCFIAAGMVRSLSPFCHAVMASYGLRLAQLHPQAVVVLAIFQHLCEGFIGIMPLVALFQHFYHTRVETAQVLAGGVTFYHRNGLAREYIKGDFKTKWDEWHHKWCYVRFLEVLDCFADPSAHVIHDKRWKNLGPQDEEFGPALERITLLRERGLTSKQVVADFIERRLA